MYTMSTHYTVKYIRISTIILWRVFHILTEPVPYSFESINRRNNEARNVGPWLRYFLDKVDLRVQTEYLYTEQVPLKCGYTSWYSFWSTDVAPTRRFADRRYADNVVSA